MGRATLHGAAGSDTRLALLIAWLVFSAVMLFALAAPFLMPTATVERLSPDCMWRTRFGRPCPMCGMTRAFIAISNADFAGARKTNRWSCPLYASFVCNEIVALCFVGGMGLAKSARKGW